MVDFFKLFIKSFIKLAVWAIMFIILITLSVGPIVVTICVAEYIGYWWIALLVVAIVWGIAFSFSFIYALSNSDFLKRIQL